jgi:hypothetical protein
MSAPIFPMTTQTLSHRYGGRVTKVHGVEHLKATPVRGRSRDFWFFRADIEWSDGSKSDGTEVPPHALCCDEPSTNAELRALLDAMNAYLNEHGEWKHDAKQQGWFAKRGPGRIAKTGSAR